jgi:hypothetical protein
MTPEDVATLLPQPKSKLRDTVFKNPQLILEFMF